MQIDAMQPITSDSHFNSFPCTADSRHTYNRSFGIRSVNSFKTLVFLFEKCDVISQWYL